MDAGKGEKEEENGSLPVPGLKGGGEGRQGRCHEELRSQIKGYQDRRKSQESGRDIVYGYGERGKEEIPRQQL